MPPLGVHNKQQTQQPDPAMPTPAVPAPATTILKPAARPTTTSAGTAPTTYNYGHISNFPVTLSITVCPTAGPSPGF